MEFEQKENKKKYVKIGISIDKELYEQLEQERQMKGIPVSTNLCIAVKERQKTINSLQVVTQELEQRNKMIEQYNIILEDANKKIKGKELELEKYQRIKNRGYFQKVIRAIFNIDD